MLSLLNEIQPGLNLDSKVSDMYDGWDFVALILECEKYYNFIIYDDEAMLFEDKDLTFLQIEDFFIFLRDGYATSFISKLIIDNINWLRPFRSEYESYIINNRNNKINDLLN
jgi:hypothetical protein